MSGTFVAAAGDPVDPALIEAFHARHPVAASDHRRRWRILLAIEVIAEGVETTEQHAFLEAMGCRLFQGYLYGAPVTAEEFAGVLATSHSRRGRPTAERVAARA